MGEREEQNYPGDGVGEGFGFVLFSDEELGDVYRL